MVVAVVALFLFNTVLSTSLNVLRNRAVVATGGNDFLFTAAGRVLGEVVTIGFTVALFFLVYRFASTRRLPWRSAVVASLFTTVAFELAKRLFSAYLAGVLGERGLSLDANLGAVLLFVLWIWYTAIVFLLGGVVAETWDLRERVKGQRAVLV